MGRATPGPAGSEYAHAGAARRSFRSDRAATRWGDTVTRSSLRAASPSLDLLAGPGNCWRALCSPGASDPARSFLDAFIHRAPGSHDGLFAWILATSTGRRRVASSLLDCDWSGLSLRSGGRSCPRDRAGHADLASPGAGNTLLCRL